MGCFSLHFPTARSSKIKITTVDGHCRKFDAPMYVKEMLVEHPDHAIFHSLTVRKLGSRARPLPGTMALQPGQSYILVPQLPRRNASRLLPKLSEPIKSSQQVAPAAVLEQRAPSSSTRRVSFACCPSLVDAADSTSQPAPAIKSFHAATARKPSVEVLPSSSDGVVRVKAVVSKSQLAAILGEGGDALSMVESLLTPLLKQCEGARSTNRSSGEVSKENSFPWRPALESIPESSCPKRKAAHCGAAC